MNTKAAHALATVETVGHFINGRIVPGTGRSQDVYNPATGNAVRQVAANVGMPVVK